MEEDTEYLKLPLEDRCVHKVSAVFCVVVCEFVLSCGCTYVHVSLRVYVCLCFFVSVRVLVLL